MSTGVDCWALSQRNEDVTIETLVEDIVEQVERFETRLILYQDKVRKVLTERT